MRARCSPIPPVANCGSPRGAGYAHGFAVLSEYADFEYKCTNYYQPEDETGVIWNDPEVGIDWPRGLDLVLDAIRKQAPQGA